MTQDPVPSPGELTSSLHSDDNLNSLSHKVAKSQVRGSRRWPWSSGQCPVLRRGWRPLLGHKLLPCSPAGTASAQKQGSDPRGNHPGRPCGLPAGPGDALGEGRERQEAPKVTNGRNDPGHDVRFKPEEADHPETTGVKVSADIGRTGGFITKLFEFQERRSSAGTH